MQDVGRQYALKNKAFGRSAGRWFGRSEAVKPEACTAQPFGSSETGTKFVRRFHRFRRFFLGIFP